MHRQGHAVRDLGLSRAQPDQARRPDAVAVESASDHPGNVRDGPVVEGTERCPVRQESAAFLRIADILVNGVNALTSDEVNCRNVTPSGSGRATTSSTRAEKTTYVSNLIRFSSRLGSRASIRQTDFPFATTTDN